MIDTPRFLPTKYILAFGLLLLFAAPHARAQAADEINTLRLAQTYEQGGRYEDALRYFEDLYRQRPANSAYFEGVRRCLTALKRHDDVRALLTQRLAQYPRDFSLLVHRGGLAMQRYGLDSARADFEAAIDLNPKNAQAYSMIADYLVNARANREAIDYLRRGREMLRSPQMYVFEIARAAVMEMDYETAMDEYLSYLRASPQTLYQIQQQIGMFSDIPEALDAAVRSARRQAEATPDIAAVQYLLAWLLMERKDYAGAYSVYREIDRLNKAGGMEIVTFANRAYNDKSYAVAAQAFGDAAAAFPDASFAPQAEFNRARSLEELYAAEGLPDALQPEGAAAGGEGLPSSEAVTSYQGAIRLYEQLAKKYPQQSVGSDSRYRIGFIRFHRFGDSDGALEILRGIAETRRSVYGNPDADVLIGDILVARGDLDGAIAQYDRLLPSPRLDPQLRSELRFKVAEAYFFKGEFDTVLVQLEPLTADIGTDIANDALDLGALIAQYRQPGELPLQRYAQALFLERQRKLSEAAAAAADIITEFGSSDIVDLAYLKQAELLRRIGRAADAAATYTAFLDVRKESFLRDRGLFFLAELKEAELGDPSAAMALYQQMLAEHPHSQFAARARERIVSLRKGNS